MKYTIDHDGDITPGFNTYFDDSPVMKLEPKKSPWGKSGTRFDEDCERCHRNGEVDNNTGLCQRCGR